MTGLKIISLNFCVQAGQRLFRPGREVPKRREPDEQLLSIPVVVVISVGLAASRPYPPREPTRPVLLTEPATTVDNEPRTEMQQQLQPVRRRVVFFCSDWCRGDLWREARVQAVRLVARRGVLDCFDAYCLRQWIVGCRRQLSEPVSRPAVLEPHGGLFDEVDAH